MQRGAPIAVPERGHSLPPLYFHPSESLHDLPTPSPTSAVMMDPAAPKAFPWTRLPNMIQLRVLSFAVLPEGPDTALIVGDSDHSKHLRKVAVPVFLGLGSWSGYCNAMRILYRNVHLDLCNHRRSSVIFLTSVNGLRPRNMVVKLRMALDIKKSLPLFDTGHTIRQSKGKLIKVNVPTALRCMKVHGRLSEVQFLIDSMFATAEQKQRVPEDYLPMAEIQLVNRNVLKMLDDHAASSSVGFGPNTRQAQTVIAPAFLACRAWQSGFLPLFEDGTFHEGTTLAVISKRNQSDQDQTAGEGVVVAISRVDGASLMRFWLGGTIVELLDDAVHPSSWIDPFTLSTQPSDDLDGTGSNVGNCQSDHTIQNGAAADSVNDGNDIPPSPANTGDSLSDSASASGENECEEQHNAVNLQKRPHDTRPVYRSSHDRPGVSKGYDTPSDDGSLSDEVEMQNLHQRYGIGSKVRENAFSASPSSSESLTHSMLVGGTASPSSDSDLEAC